MNTTNLAKSFNRFVAIYRDIWRRQYTWWCMGGGGSIPGGAGGEGSIPGGAGGEESVLGRCGCGFCITTTLALIRDTFSKYINKK